MSAEICPICGSKHVTQRFSKRFLGQDFDILHCKSCHTEFISDIYEEGKLQGKFDDVQISYFNQDENLLLDNSLNRDYWLGERKIINALGYTQGTILDVGCNAGHFLDNMGDRWDKYGLEISPKASAISLSKGIKVSRSEMTSTAFLDNFFDVISLYAVIEHLVSPKETIDELTRILRPGGLLILMTGARNSIKARLKSTGWHMYCPPIHLFFFEYVSLCYLLKNNRYKEIYKKYTSGGMSWVSKDEGIWRGLTVVEQKLKRGILETPFLWRFPFYDHLYIYSQKR